MFRLRRSLFSSSKLETDTSSHMLFGVVSTWTWLVRNVGFAVSAIVVALIPVCVGLVRYHAGCNHGVLTAERREGCRDEHRARSQRKGNGHHPRRSSKASEKRGNWRLLRPQKYRWLHQYSDVFQKPAKLKNKTVETAHFWAHNMYTTIEHVGQIVPLSQHKSNTYWNTMNKCILRPKKFQYGLSKKEEAGWNE